MFQLTEVARTLDSQQLDSLPPGNDDDMVEEELLDPGRKKRGFCSQPVTCCFNLVRTTRGRCWGACCCCGTISFYLYLALMLQYVAHWHTYPGSKYPDDSSVCTSIRFPSNYDGREMQGCRRPLVSQPKAPILFFHGNGGTMSSAVTQVGQLMNVQKPLPALEIFSYSYRGYDPNQGTSSQSKIVGDAEALLDMVLKLDVYRGGRAIVGGWSLGSAVAIQLAARRPESVAGLIVVSPFDSIADMAALIFGSWVLPWTWVADNWDSLSAAETLPEEMPVAVMSAQHDEEIPPAMHRRVFDALRTRHKWWLPTRMANHGDIPMEASKQVEGLAQWLKATMKRTPGE